MKKIIFLLSLLALLSCKKTVESGITYPRDGAYGPNLLAAGNSEFVCLGSDYYPVSLTAQFNSVSSLKVEFFTRPITDIAGADTTAPEDYPYSWYGMSVFQPDMGWSYTLFDNVNHSQIFTTTKSTGTVDLKIYLEAYGSLIMKIYENGSPKASRIKTVKWTRQTK
jgi:hypothetical protein